MPLPICKGRAPGTRRRAEQWRSEERWAGRADSAAVWPGSDDCGVVWLRGVAAGGPPRGSGGPGWRTRQRRGWAAGSGARVGRRAGRRGGAVGRAGGLVRDVAGRLGCRAASAGSRADGLGGPPRDVHILIYIRDSAWRILKPTKKKIGKWEWYYYKFNSGEIKTKLLTLPLLWAYRSTTKCTLHHLVLEFHVNPISVRQNPRNCARN